MSSSHTQVDIQVDNAPNPPTLTRRDTFEVPDWDQRNLLSLDGGGVRGYWSLLVLERLMRAIGEEERTQAGGKNDALHSFMPQELPKNYTQCAETLPANGNNRKQYHAQRFLPCHYFDLIVGSSTGSLIAIMLSRFRMTVADCLEEYETMGQKIFGNPRWISQRHIGIVKRPKYDAKAMADAFLEVTDRRDAVLPGTEVRPVGTIKTHEGTCSMFATTMRRVKNGRNPSVELPHVLRSYYHPETYKTKTSLNYDPSEANTAFEVWLVARAATAAPMYFEEVRIPTPQGTIIYSDGGFGRTNNPTKQGKKELEILNIRENDGQEILGQIGVIVSVGTARARDQAGGRGLLRLIKKFASKATNPQDVADDLDDLDLENYWRLNDTDGIDVDLDDWSPRKSGKKTLKRIRKGFLTWAANEDNQDMLKDCARELVKRRRARTTDVERWERFSSVTKFTCRCHGYGPFHFRSDFDTHYQTQHIPRNETTLEIPTISTWEYPARSSGSSSSGLLRSSTARNLQTR